MNSNDPRINDAAIYIREAIRMLEAAQMTHHLDHSDMTTVGAALEGLDIIQRAIGAPSRHDGARIAIRLRQVANAVNGCTEPSLAMTHVDIETAADLFRLVADETAAS